MKKADKQRITDDDIRAALLLIGEQNRPHLDAIMEYYCNNPSPIYGYCMCDHCKEWRTIGECRDE